ncbi:MAG: serine/threonine protein phosphatase, partial [Erythrobacteraceae bacterium]|nr:serine/threonine protein phosphatase [Erythrobacteraceae bacterium]
VHGHTIFETVEHRPHRIGVDTGAFRFGRLTALVLEGETQRFIQASQISENGEGEGSVSIERWGDET